MEVENLNSAEERVKKRKTSDKMGRRFTTPLPPPANPTNPKLADVLA